MSACSSCSLRLFCLASGEDAQPAVYGPLRRRLRPGEVVFRKGDAMAVLRAVHSGAVKTCAVLPDGERRIVGYHIVGDVLGLDALGSGVHPTEAVALDDCELCEMAVEKAGRLMSSREPLEARLRALLSDQIARDSERIVALGAYSARQRVAAFLLEVAQRWSSRGYSEGRFDLCLTRKEIGSYLGLTFETVSRALSGLAGRKVIHVTGREVRILDRAALEAQALSR